jgi:hypothetical protein
VVSAMRQPTRKIAADNLPLSEVKQKAAGAAEGLSCLGGWAWRVGQIAGEGRKAARRP